MLMAADRVCQSGAADVGTHAESRLALFSTGCRDDVVHMSKLQVDRLHEDLVLGNGIDEKHVGIWKVFAQSWGPRVDADIDDGAWLETQSLDEQHHITDAVAIDLGRVTGES